MANFRGLVLGRKEGIVRMVLGSTEATFLNQILVRKGILFEKEIEKKGYGRKI